MTIFGRRWRRWQIGLLAVLVAIVATLCTAWLWRQSTINGWRARTFEIDLQRAERAATNSDNKRGAESLQGGISREPTALSSAHRLAQLYARGGDPRILARDAALAADPVLWVRSFDSLILCTHGKFSAPFSPEALSAMRSGNKPMSEREIADLVSLSSKFRDMAPTRWTLPDGMLTALEAMMASGIRAVDPAFEREMERAMEAPLSDVDRVAREQILTSTRAFCASEDSSNPWAAYREGRARWVAQGSTGALLRNRQAGWTSKGVDALTEADYALVERIVRERQPDGLAALLSPINAFDMRILVEGEPRDLRVLLGRLAGASVVAALSACELGVNDCSANSPLFKQNCVDFGGCYLPDLAAQARYILARDGLDPQWFDREAARVAKAIYEGDLDALGIRRESSKSKP